MINYAKPSKKVQKNPRSGSRPATILIVEDQQDQMVLLTHMLTAAGFRVVPAYGGEDAIDKMKTQKIDLVVTDLAMPKVSGVQVIAAAKADPDIQNVPIIVVTAYTWDQIGNAALDAGADGYVGKPFAAPRLVGEVNKHLDHPVVRLKTLSDGQRGMSSSTRPRSNGLVAVLLSN